MVSLSVSWWGGDVISQKWWMMVIWQTSIISVLDIIWWFFLFIFSYWLEVISLMVLACIYKFKFNLVDIWESFSIRHILISDLSNLRLYFHTHKLEMQRHRYRHIIISVKLFKKNKFYWQYMLISIDYDKPTGFVICILEQLKITSYFTRKANIFGHFWTRMRIMKRPVRTISFFEN